MLFGPPPPSFAVNGKLIEWADGYKYVGVFFMSTTRHILSSLYTSKVGKARSVTHAIFALEPMMGCLPLKEGIALYWARVNSYLTFGCEVAIDVDDSLGFPVPDTTPVPKTPLRSPQWLLHCTTFLGNRNENLSISKSGSCLGFPRLPSLTPTESCRPMRAGKCLSSLG